MTSSRSLALAIAIASLGILSAHTATAYAAECGLRICPVVETTPGALTAAYVVASPGDSWMASNAAPSAHPYTYRLSTPCELDTAAGGACRPDDDALCPAPPDRVVQVMVVEQQRVVLPDGSTADGFDPSGSPPGTAVGPWLPLGRGCVDITALNPPPSPGEVFRYFQTLPLPDLPTQQQPPGNALAGLPVVFYTDGPTTQTFTVNIRGFTVDIVATASAFSWDTGEDRKSTRLNSSHSSPSRMPSSA